MSIFLGSCKNEQPNKNVIKPTSESEAIVLENSFETKEVKEGDMVMLYGGDDSQLRLKFGGDTCHALVKKIVRVKSKGLFAYLQFQDFNSYDTDYSIELYYINSTQGYRATDLHIWQRSLTNIEIKEMVKNWGSDIQDFRIDSNIKFKITKHNKN